MTYDNSERDNLVFGLKRYGVGRINLRDLRNSFRSWWQIPRRAQDRTDERTVTFLELFYDLVYVVIIAELAHALAEHPDIGGVGTFVFLFIIVWWAWLNGSMYHDLHGNNDVRTRVFTFLQMFAVGGMAIFAHNAMGEGAFGFAISYGFFQLILTYLWWRTGVHDPDHRPYSTPYVIGFVVSTILWFASAFVPEPWNFVMWGISVPFTLLMPIRNMKMMWKNPEVSESDFGFITASAVERFGLFTIIVLGEIFVGVINGTTSAHDLNWNIGLTAALGMGIAFALWWVYFDFVSHRLPIKRYLQQISWVYLHLPATMGMAAVGALVLNLIEHSGEHLHDDVRWLFVGTVAVVLISISILIRVVQVVESRKPLYKKGGWVTLSAGIVIALLGFTNLDVIPLMIIVIALILAPIFYGLRVWIMILIEQESGNG